MKLKELHETQSAGHTVADFNIPYEQDGGSFTCQGKKLTSLKGSPKEISGDFNVGLNSLTSLEFGPIKVVRSYYCQNNKLTSLKGLPEKIGKYLNANTNKITSLEGVSKIIGGDAHFSNNELTSLEGIHLQLNRLDGSAFFDYNPIKSHVLGLLLIDGLQYVKLDNTEVQKIINKYLAGSRDVMDCQNELMDAGLDEYAQL